MISQFRLKTSNHFQLELKQYSPPHVTLGMNLSDNACQQKSPAGIPAFRKFLEANWKRWLSNMLVTIPVCQRSVFLSVKLRVGVVLRTITLPSRHALTGPDIHWSSPSHVLTRPRFFNLADLTTYQNIIVAGVNIWRRFDKKWRSFEVLFSAVSIPYCFSELSFRKHSFGAERRKINKSLFRSVFKCASA